MSYNRAKLMKKLIEIQEGTKEKNQTVAKKPTKKTTAAKKIAKVASSKQRSAPHG